MCDYASEVRLGDNGLYEREENTLPGNSLATDDGQQQIFVSVVTAAHQLPKFLASESPGYVLRRKKVDETKLNLFIVHPIGDANNFYFCVT